MADSSTENAAGSGIDLTQFPESVSLDCPAAQFWFDDLFGGKSRTDFPPDMRNGGLEAGHFGSIGAVVV